jgi:NAD+ synthase (glutamine-hydrolysing)
MAQRCGVRYDEMPIGAGVRGVPGDARARNSSRPPQDTTEENIQARIRGTLLMALSNKYGSIVLTTGNKSEMAVGYARCMATWPAASR